MPKKICHSRGCNCLIPYNKTYCPEHELERIATKQENDRKYDAHVRRNSDNIKYDQFYHSKEFDMAKKRALVKCQGIDLYDYYMKREITPAKICHHIIPLKEDWDKRCDLTNLFYLSDANHNYIESIYDKGGPEKRAMQNLLRKLYSKFQRGEGL